MGGQTMNDPNNLEGSRTREEIAENFRELNQIAPTPADKFRLMFVQPPFQHNEHRTTPSDLPPEGSGES